GRPGRLCQPSERSAAGNDQIESLSIRRICYLQERFASAIVDPVVFADAIRSCRHDGWLLRIRSAPANMMVGC
ncbi:MAG: hypothetical protein WBN81_01500, partial [Gammaproteobacteria bacterium]